MYRARYRLAKALSNRLHLHYMLQRRKESVNQIIFAVIFPVFYAILYGNGLALNQTRHEIRLLSRDPRHLRKMDTRNTGGY